MGTSPRATNDPSTKPVLKAIVTRFYRMGLQFLAGASKVPTWMFLLFAVSWAGAALEDGKQARRPKVCRFSRRRARLVFRLYAASNATMSIPARQPPLRLRRRVANDENFAACKARLFVKPKPQPVRHDRLLGGSRTPYRTKIPTRRVCRESDRQPISPSQNIHACVQ